MILLTSGSSVASPPQTYPQSYANVIEAARKEKDLVVYGAVQADPTFSDLVTVFQRRYPFINIKSFVDDGGPPYERFRREVAAGLPSADFLWNLAMDMQEKFINDGYSQAYTSPEMPFLLSSAHWQDLGYGVAQVPVAFVYNSRFLKSWEMPRTHDGLKQMLERQPAKFRNRVAIYDPENSNLGMLLLSQDIRITKDNWNLFDTFGAVNAQGYNGSREILKHLLNGDQWIGYDVASSFAVEMQKTHPELVIVYPSDYVLLISRVAFISASAPHPNTAKLFLDFLLSREGQENLERHGMETVRTDTAPSGGHTRIDPIRTQAVRIGPGLLANLDSLVRAQFLRRWGEAQSRNAGVTAPAVH